MLIRRLNDWVILTLSGVILVSVTYLFYCDKIDGHILFPVLEMGARSSLYTHQTTKQKYHPGEMVYARVLMKKNRAITGILQWSLVNDEVKTFKSRPGSLPIGVWDIIVPMEPIPEDAKPGKYWFCGGITYQVNWLGKKHYDLWSNDFIIEKKKK